MNAADCGEPTELILGASVDDIKETLLDLFGDWAARAASHHNLVDRADGCHFRRRPVKNTSSAI